ncbi:hypothetical protein [Catenulispora subtropica]|uniref:hypothetical protein n=1 Tax=Catenulispora subtropica TaxID=450798 RepID=UPI0031D3F4EC
MTGAPNPSSPAGDGLAAVRARAAEAGVSVSEYVREALWRARGEEAWERALAQAREERVEEPEGEIG